MQLADVYWTCGVPFIDRSTGDVSCWRDATSQLGVRSERSSGTPLSTGDFMLVYGMPNPVAMGRWAADRK